jgi:hypothetical protein
MPPALATTTPTPCGSPAMLVEADIARWTFMAPPVWLSSFLPLCLATHINGGGGYARHKVRRDVLHMMLDATGMKRFVVTKESEVMWVILKVSLCVATTATLKTISLSLLPGLV